MVNSPNLYNEKAFKLGKEAFINDNGLIVNPYDKKAEEDNYMDWRIGWQTAKWEQNIKKKDNDI